MLVSKNGHMLLSQPVQYHRTLDRNHTHKSATCHLDLDTKCPSHNNSYLNFPHYYFLHYANEVPNYKLKAPNDIEFQQVAYQEKKKIKVSALSLISIYTSRAIFPETAKEAL